MNLYIISKDFGEKIQYADVSHVYNTYLLSDDDTNRNFICDINSDIEQIHYFVKANSLEEAFKIIIENETEHENEH